MKLLEYARKGIYMKPLLILIAGPYMSGTDGDTTKIAVNRARLESYALPIFESLDDIPTLSHGAGDAK
jgi:hypothetical protein